MRMIGPELKGRVLEVGIGTGLNLPLYPRDMNLVGIDLSEGMLRKAQDKVQELRMSSVTLKVMDASSLDFGDAEFDATLATYTISAVPDPVAVLREMRRVTKPGGTIVILNHFRSRNPVMRRIEDALAPVCAHLGWKTNLVLDPAAEDRRPHARGGPPRQPAARMAPRQVHQPGAVTAPGADLPRPRTVPLTRRRGRGVAPRRCCR